MVRFRNINGVQVPFTASEEAERDVEEAASIAGRLPALREESEITKQKLCLALYSTGILSSDDATLAINGGWPAAFLPALDGLTETEKGEALLTWAGAHDIPRMHPLILLMQSFSASSPEVPDLTDAVMDGIFGISL